MDGGRDGPRADVGPGPPFDASPDTAKVNCPGYPSAILCDNFDDGLDAGWSSTSLSATTASLGLSDAEVVSPPLSLFSVVDPDGVTGEATAALVLDVPRTFGKVRNSYDLYVDQIGSRSTAIGSIYLQDGMTKYYGVYLFAHGAPGAIALTEDGYLSDGGEAVIVHDAGATLPVKAWMRIILEVDYAAPATATLTIEIPPGASATPVVYPITPTITGVTTSVYGGLDYVVFPEAIGWQIYVDNVVVETPP
jgi:hypothetical protein